MTASRTTLVLVLAGALALAGCAEEDSPLEPGLHAISGRVQLVGYRATGGAVVLGPRAVDDADGVPVELEFGAQVVARTATVDGAYRFDGLAPGSYRVRSTVVNRVTDRTDILTIRYTDVAAADTLKLVSDGDLGVAPNPIGAGVSFRYTVFARAAVLLRILDLGGRPVMVLADSVAETGVKTAFWAGVDSTGAQAPGSVYWATLESGTDQRAQLLFR